MAAACLAVLIVLAHLQGGPPIQKQGPTGAPKFGGVPEIVAPVTMRVRTARRTYAPGDSIHIVVRATNRSKETKRLRFATAQRFDVVIRRGTDGKGQVVWRWSRGKMFTDMVSTRALEPGKYLEFRVNWPETAAGSETREQRARPLQPGRYTVTGTLVLMGSMPNPAASVVITVASGAPQARTSRLRPAMPSGPRSWPFPSARTCSIPPRRPGWLRRSPSAPRST